MLSEGTSYVTPLKRYRAHGNSAILAAGRSPARPVRSEDEPRSVRRALVRGAAVVSVVSLVGACALPATAQSFAAASAARGVAAQQLVSAASTQGAASLDAVGAVEFAATTRLSGPVAPEQGLVDPATLVETELQMPIRGAMQLTDGFGYRTAPVAQFHDAQDIAAANGTAITVIGGGIVIEAGWSDDGCGFGLKVQHLVAGETVTSRYCHMEADSHDYAVGDAVVMGDPAGRVGNTGMSFGAHLHLALRLEGEPVDPLPYITEHLADAS